MAEQQRATERPLAGQGLGGPVFSGQGSQIKESKAR